MYTFSYPKKDRERMKKEGRWGTRKERGGERERERERERLHKPTFNLLEDDNRGIDH